MGKSRRGRLTERDVNSQLAERLENNGTMVLREVRLPPCEIDIIAFNSCSLELAAIEIKRDNWRELLEQTIRAQLYCHYAWAVLPLSLSQSVPRRDFSLRGIGLVFYEEDPFGLQVAIKAQRSRFTNRFLKRAIYKLLENRFGEEIYARAD